MLPAVVASFVMLVASSVVLGAEVRLDYAAFPATPTKVDLRQLATINGIADDSMALVIASPPPSGLQLGTDDDCGDTPVAAAFRLTSITWATTATLSGTTTLCNIAVTGRGSPLPTRALLPTNATLTVRRVWVTADRFPDLVGGLSRATADFRWLVVTGRFYAEANDDAVMVVRDSVVNATGVLPIDPSAGVSAVAIRGTMSNAIIVLSNVTVFARALQSGVGIDLNTQTQQNAAPAAQPARVEIVGCRLTNVAAGRAEVPSYSNTAPRTAVSGIVVQFSAAAPRQVGGISLLNISGNAIDLVVPAMTPKPATAPLSGGDGRSAVTAVRFASGVVPLVLEVAGNTINVTAKLGGLVSAPPVPLPSDVVGIVVEVPPVTGAPHGVIRVHRNTVTARSDAFDGVAATDGRVVAAAITCASVDPSDVAEVGGVVTGGNTFDCSRAHANALSGCLSVMMIASRSSITVAHNAIAAVALAPAAGAAAATSSLASVVVLVLAAPRTTRGGAITVVNNTLAVRSAARPTLEVLVVYINVSMLVATSGAMPPSLPVDLVIAGNSVGAPEGFTRTIAGVDVRFGAPGAPLLSSITMVNNTFPCAGLSLSAGGALSSAAAIIGPGVVTIANNTYSTGGRSCASQSSLVYNFAPSSVDSGAGAATGIAISGERYVVEQGAGGSRLRYLIFVADASPTCTAFAAYSDFVMDDVATVGAPLTLAGAVAAGFVVCPASPLRLVLGVAPRVSNVRLALRGTVNYIIGAAFFVAAESGGASAALVFHSNVIDAREVTSVDFSVLLHFAVAVALPAGSWSIKQNAFLLLPRANATDDAPDSGTCFCVAGIVNAGWPRTIAVRNNTCWQTGSWILGIVVEQDGTATARITNAQLAIEGNTLIVAQPARPVAYRAANDREIQTSVLLAGPLSFEGASSSVRVAFNSVAYTSCNASKVIGGIRVVGPRFDGVTLFVTDNAVRIAADPAGGGGGSIAGVQLTLELSGSRGTGNARVSRNVILIPRARRFVAAVQISLSDALWSDVGPGRLAYGTLSLTENNITLDSSLDSYGVLYAWRDSLAADVAAAPGFNVSLATNRIRVTSVSARDISITIVGSAAPAVAVAYLVNPMFNATGVALIISNISVAVNSVSAPPVTVRGVVATGAVQGPSGACVFSLRCLTTGTDGRRPFDAGWMVDIPPTDAMTVVDSVPGCDVTTPPPTTATAAPSITNVPTEPPSTAVEPPPSPVATTAPPARKPRTRSHTDGSALPWGTASSRVSPSVSATSTAPMTGGTSTRSATVVLASVRPVDGSFTLAPQSASFVSPNFQFSELALALVGAGAAFDTTRDGPDTCFARFAGNATATAAGDIAAAVGAFLASRVWPIRVSTGSATRATLNLGGQALPAALEVQLRRVGVRTDASMHCSSSHVRSTVLF